MGRWNTPFFRSDFGQKDIFQTIEDEFLKGTFNRFFRKRIENAAFLASLQCGMGF